nr:hypothetical protein Iba_chr01bCG8410 [Ipomoea batatas]
MAPKPQFSSSETEQDLSRKSLQRLDIPSGISGFLNTMFRDTSLLSLNLHAGFPVIISTTMHPIAHISLGASCISETKDSGEAGVVRLRNGGRYRDILRFKIRPSTLSDLEDSSFDDFTANTGGSVDEDEESQPRNTVP